MLYEVITVEVHFSLLPRIRSKDHMGKLASAGAHKAGDSKDLSPYNRETDIAQTARMEVLNSQNLGSRFQRNLRIFLFKLSSNHPPNSYNFV